MTDLLLSTRISADYPNKAGVLRELVIEVRPAEILGLVGQSGSGKSTLALSLMRLLGLRAGRARGRVEFQGRDLMQVSSREMQQIRGKEIALVLQSPLTALNPALRIGTQFSEAWKAHSKGDNQRRWRQVALETLKQVSLPEDEEFLKRFPGQLSVGQAQRVLIAMAVLHRPRLLLADEPTSALDVITQAEILRLFSALNREMQMAILYISHDLLAIASICHRIAILHRGEIVESGHTAQIFEDPQHAYTKQLLAALPEMPKHAAMRKC